MRDRTFLRQIWRETRPIFGRIILTDALYKLLIFFTLSPLSSWLFTRVIRSSGSSAVSNTDIIQFLASPLVLAGLFLTGVISLVIGYLETATLLQIVFAHQRGQAVSYRHVARQIRARATHFVGLGAEFFGRMLLIILPLLLLAGLLYALLLREHDINFYLKTRPRELWIAVAIAAPVALLTLVIFARTSLSWFFAVPTVLFEQLPFRRTIARSRQLTAGHRWRIARLAVLHPLLLVSLLALISTLFTALGVLLARFISNTLALTVLVGLLVIGNWLLSLLLGFIAATYPIIVTAYLYADTAAAHAVPIAYQADNKAAATLAWTRRRAAGIVLLGSLVILGAGVVVFAEALDASERTTTVTAHRGSSAVAPPNTLLSVQQAIEDGADFAEIDVQESADNVLIVNHDKDYLLAAGVARDVADLTYAETQTLDVGSTFAPEFAGERIPTLGEVLDLAKGKIKVNIELKYYGRDVDLARRVVELVREKGMQDEVEIMSLHYDGVRDVRALAPELKIGFLASQLTLGDLTELDVDFLAVASSLATRQFVSDVHSAEKQIYVWTINDAEAVPIYLNLGVDSIITDYPVVVREQIEIRGRMSAAEKLLTITLARLVDS